MSTQARWYNKWWGRFIIAISSIFLLTSMLIGVYIFLLAKEISQSPRLAAPIVDQASQQKITGKDNPWSGSTNPKITIVEFGDYACPYCKKAFSTIREIGLLYPDDIKIIYRDYPIIAEHSADLALAARCANEQDKFWNLHDKLFLNQGVRYKNEIMSLAEQIGVDRKKFESCFDNKRYYSAIAKDLADGESLGITGTPTWFINFQKVEGEIPREAFIQIINSILNNSN